MKKMILFKILILIGKINKENKQKDKKLQKMNDKLLDQERIINEYKNKINGLDKKMIEMKISQNDYNNNNNIKFINSCFDIYLINKK